VALPKKQPKKDGAPTPESNPSTPPKGNATKPGKPPAKPKPQSPPTVIEPLEDRQHI
jgi:hypothetical protein